MSSLTKTFSYSIGKKLIMGLTGLFLVIFLVEHLIGNMLMIAGPESFNEYVEFMGHNLLIRIAEVGLFAIFIVHIVDGLMVSAKNRAARKSRYAVSPKNANSSWFSRNMKVSGIIVLIFLILHLISFFLQGRFGVDVGIGIADQWNYAQEGMNSVNPEEMSLWHKAAAQFTVEWYVGIYVLAMILVAFHLNHGFQSAFQTLGLNHSKYTPIVKATGTFISIILPLGFAFIPVYFVVLKHSGKLAEYFMGPAFGVGH